MVIDSDLLFLIIQRKGFIQKSFKVPKNALTGPLIVCGELHATKQGWDIEDIDIDVKWTIF